MTTPEKKYLLALDQGTSSSRSIVFDVGGRIVAMAQREFRQIYPQPGWVEHDPKEIWATQLATAQEALVRAALLTSVACTAPPVSCHISQVSIVPNASSPRRAAARAPGTLSSSHFSFVPEK